MDDSLSTALSGLHLSEGRIALIMLVIRLLGEGISTLRNGGGLLGLGRSIIYGQNLPAAVARDYKEELKPGAKDPASTTPVT